MALSSYLKRTLQTIIAFIRFPISQRQSSQRLTHRNNAFKTRIGFVFYSLIIERVCPLRVRQTSLSQVKELVKNYQVRKLKKYRTFKNVK